MVVIAIIFVTLLLLFLLFYASYSVSAGVYLKSLCRAKGQSCKVAITFDDGVDEELTPKVLDVLKRNGAKATFFLIGSNANKFPEIVKRIVAEGHEVGNHTMNHLVKFPMGGFKKTLNEVRECSEVLESITGSKVKLFRLPFGVSNPTIGRAVRQEGLHSVGWSIRSLDTVGQSAERVASRVNSRVKGGDVVLLHDNREGVEELLQQILDNLLAKGLKAVTVSELFKL